MCSISASGLDQADPADDEFLVVLFQNIAAGIGIVLSDGVEDIVERKVVFSQQSRLDHDLVLFDKPAQGVDVHDIRQCP